MDDRLNEGVSAVLGARLLFILPVNWSRREATLNWSDAAKIDWGTIVLFGTGIISETTSNTASAAVVVPIVNPLAVAAGVDPFVPALAATFAASFGFMLPVSTPQNAIVYGSGCVPITRMIKSGICFDIPGAVLIITLIPVMASLSGIAP